MRKFKVSLLCMVVLGTLFGTGCNDMHQVFHERSGVIVTDVAPMVLKPVYTGTNEAELIVSGAFPTATVRFSNLNAIEARIRTYKVDYYDIATGARYGTLTTARQTMLTIGPVSVNAQTPTAVEGTQTTQTASAQDGLLIDPWTEAVKALMYGNLTTRTDNKALEARVDLYGEDGNGNSIVLAASFTLMP